MEDLAAHASSFVTPISASYRGHTLWEVPPSGQGITALVALNIITALEASGTIPPFGSEISTGDDNAEKKLGWGSLEQTHALIETMRLAFADTRWHVADPTHTPVPTHELLDAGYAEQRAKLFDPARASVDVERGSPADGSCTVSFQVVDTEGNAVSMVNRCAESQALLQ